MTQPDWWYPGYFIGLTIFLLLMLAFCGWMLRWGAKQVDKLELDILERDAAHVAFEAEIRRRMWPDEQ